ncbi:MAG: anti-sigma factor [Rhizobiales bacterium]|nr:anti-sigma factor [Hyphomicrobiales bacterium]
MTDASRVQDSFASDFVSRSEYPGDDKSVLAAEYALGTLDADDRANVQMLMAIDPGFATAVAQWERCLGELHALVGPVDAPATTWEWIKARIALEPQSGRVWLPTAAEITDPPLPSPVPVRFDEALPPLDDVPGEPVAPRLEPAHEPEAAAPDQAQPSRPPPPPFAFVEEDEPPAETGGRGWRAAALLLGLLVFALGTLTAMRETHPDLLPDVLRPISRYVDRPVEVIRTVEVVREIPSPRIAEYVAMLQKDAATPAFTLTMDMGRRALSVRRFGTKAPPGKDYELWIVSNRLPGPRSLGVIGEDEFTVRRELTDYEAPVLSGANYIVTLEPAGGSLASAPSGQTVFSGRLLQTTPPEFPTAP